MSDTAAGAHSTELPTFPKSQRTCPLHPPPEYAELRAERPVTRVALPSGETAWLITRHEYALQVFSDTRASSDWTHPSFPFPVPNPRRAVREMSRFGQALLGLDPPAHTDRRRALITEFTLKRVQAMRPRLQEIVDAHVDEMLAVGPPLDLVQALSLPVPATVICELLGVPYSDRAFFKQRTSTLLKRHAGAESRGTAVSDLLDYFDKLITAKEADPGDDLFGRLIVKNREIGAFDHELLVALGLLLLMGGHETTVEMISLGTVALLEDPDQLAELKADSSLMPLAVEELLRYFSVGAAVPRVATADIEIGGELIKEGEGMFLMLSAAARDGEVFADPDRLDIHRGARNHLAFGHGIHQCLGQNLARLELEIVFNTLFARIPGLRLDAPMAELPFKNDALVYGLYELPVAW